MRAEPEKEKIKEVLASTRLLGSNMQRMLNKDFTRSIHAESFSRAPKERLCWQDVREYVTSNYLLNLRKLFISLPGQCCQENQAPGVALRLVTEKEYTPYLVLCNLSPYKTLISHLTVVATKGSIACIVSVSVRFRSKERGTRVKDRAKNGSRLI